MKIFTANDLTKTIGDKQLFKEISFAIAEKERIGLIGVNGTGKSTLLKIIAGIDDMDGGSFTKPNDYKISILLQEPDLNPELTVLEQILSTDNPINNTVRDYEKIVVALSNEPENEKLLDKYFRLQKTMDDVNGWDVSSQAKTMLTKLGISDYNQPVSQLSGGQKKRVALAEVLLNKADLLLLDEPTNHLDSEMIKWLQEELVKYPSSVLFVTHDRYFLDAVSNRIFELFEGQLYSYKGNYADYLEAKSIREEETIRQREKAENLYRRELAWIRRGAQARSTKQKARIDRFNELDKVVSQKTQNNQVDLSFSGSRLGKDVIEIKDAYKSFDNKQILHNFNLLVKQGERIGIVGKNGSGKSTLLNIIAGKETLDEGDLRLGQTVKLAYYTQESVDMDVNKRMIEYIREAGDVIHTKDGKTISAAQMLERFLFPMHTHGTIIRKLSGGERRRLYLLKLLMEEPNVLLLDEPTNDLDTETLTVLEQFLEEFSGVVITVSHDRYFLDKVCDQLLIFQGNGKIENYFGEYSDYLAESQKKSVKTEVDKEPKVTEKQKDSIEKKVKKKLTYKEQKEWETIETKISEVEEKIAGIKAEMETCGSDFTKLQQLMEEEKKYEAELEFLMERWEYLAEFAE
ncbi:ABC-F family ATP-binding cassette domain-containing protein [Pallidibacillus pasinlerensis]|uniref:ABC-F family ATP-binding cassette domain-containing protein n=1 Tax=Pallidibacillus pasinlerensis TaxID=2703818 RepID=A0ABX0A1G8_9BACI|nr:ABC-F family ATP-binding cassette domain-containing protein [Pallidibacillus pasinlerensis]NCU17247.1 ABC-F family ATP-binding cassette domain-containing protein [Pallidibacillus pasinlerensis]